MLYYRPLSFALLLTAFFYCASAQDHAPIAYYDLVKEADSLYKIKDYKQAALTYHAAFYTFGGMGYMDDRINAARCWAQTGFPDSAFYNLNRIVNKGYYKELANINVDAELLSLRNDKRWQLLLDGIGANKKKAQIVWDNPLVQLIDSMATEDQKWRLLWNEYENKQNDSIPLDTILKHWKRTDSLNYFRVRDIFSIYCYPNYDLVGEYGAQKFWLLIQHQDRHPAFQDSVLSEMKKEVDNGKASPVNYAYLVDRVKINTHQLQVYGTQMQLNKDSTSYQPIPVIDPAHLDERRKSMGISPMKDYIDLMNKNNLGSLKK